MRRVRRSRWLLLIAASASALGGAELALRSLRPEAIETASLSLYRNDSITSFSLQPGFVSHLPDGSNVVINDQGLRDDPIVVPRPPGVVRVLCLGDSFAFGLGVDVELSFPKICQRTLREVGVPESEVVNCGVPAWGTEESRLFLCDRGLALEPNAVVLSIFLGNDTFDDLASGEFEVVAGLLVPAKHGSELPWDHHLDRSALWQLGKQIGGSLLHSDRPQIVTTAGAKRRTFGEMLEIYRTEERPDSDAARGAARVLANVSAIRDALRDRNILFGVVLIPALCEVDDAAFAQALAREDLPRAEFDPDAAGRRMRAELARLCVPHLDLSPGFREATNGEGRKLYLRNYHLNEKGNTIAGRQLAQFLRDALGLRSPP